MTTMTWGFEVPAPYTYPRWTLRDGQLVAVQPIVDSLEGLRKALRSPDAWSRFVDQLRAHDLSFDAMLFRADFADASALGRCIRRAHGQRHQDVIDERYISADGFKNTDDIVAIARLLLQRFVSDVREDGRVPVFVLLHDRGMKDYLYRAVGETLQASGVAFFSSHEVADSADSSNYLPDGHFVREVDVRMAHRVLELVRRVKSASGP